MKLLIRITRSIRKRVRPTKRELAMKCWRRNGGDKRHRFDCRLDANSIVFDMGGYEGTWAAEIFNRFGCGVEIFEPVKVFADKISGRFHDNPRLRVHACGLAAKTRVENISLSSDSSSVFTKPVGVTVPVELKDVCAWFADHGVQRIDLMKINIEGGEYELLERMLDTSLVSKVDQFQIQFHDLGPDSEARMESIRARLSSTHDPLYHYYFIWDGWQLKPDVNASAGVDR